MASHNTTSVCPTGHAAPLLAADSAFDELLPSVPQRLAAVLEGLSVGELRACGDSEDNAEDSTPYTLLTLFTADGLLEALEWANAGQPADENACLWLAYLRWLRSQASPWPESAPSPLPRWLDDAANQAAGPGPAAPAIQQTLEALSTGQMGEVERPVLPEAQDPDVLLRSVVLGLLPTGWKAVTAMAVNGAAITHGHPEAQVASVGAALMVQATVTASLRGCPRPVRCALAATLEILPQVTRPGHATVDALQHVAESAPTYPYDDDAMAPVPGATSTQVLAAGVRAALEREACGQSAWDQRPVAAAAVEALACALVGAAGGKQALEAGAHCQAPQHMVEMIHQVAARWSQQLGITAGH